MSTTPSKALLTRAQKAVDVFYDPDADEGCCEAGAKCAAALDDLLKVLTPKGDVTP
jgi:hypothetical protein